jgi:thymidylate synthase (FAD)
MNKVQILDHGYIALVETWGSDERIIEAARQSTGKGFRTWSPYKECTACNAWVLQGDEEPQCVNEEHSWRDVPRGDAGLLGFLHGNRHSTPFEFAGMVIEVQAPIFVFREWHRHRTQSYNEMSARYTPLPDLNYTPTADRCLVVNGANKQANKVAGAAELTHESVLEWLAELEHSYEVAETCYQSGLRRGIPKELARLPVPVARYSRMRAATNLRNWLAFLTLRMDRNAQYEIRMFANAVGDLIKQAHPRTWELFVEGRK